MPERENTIQLTTDRRSQVDWERASRILKALTGRVVVEMDPEPDHLPGCPNILLPDVAYDANGEVIRVKGNLAPEVGTVLSSGVDFLKAGERVAVRPYDGTWINDADLGGYKPEGQVRTFGVHNQYPGQPIRVPWHESIPMKFVMETYQATGKNVLLRRHAFVETEGGILLSEEAQYRSCTATVVSVGELVLDVCAGDTLHYNPGCVIDFMFPDDKDLCLIDEDGINFVIKQDVAA